MKRLVTIIYLSFMAVSISFCNHFSSVNNETASYRSATDTELAEFISKIKAVDNHAHPNTIEADDKGSDALPLDGLGVIELPARLRPESPDWIAALKAMYGFSGTVLNEKAMKEAEKAAKKEKEALEKKQKEAEKAAKKEREELEKKQKEAAKKNTAKGQ